MMSEGIQPTPRFYTHTNTHSLSHTWLTHTCLFAWPHLSGSLLRRCDQLGLVHLHRQKPRPGATRSSAQREGALATLSPSAAHHHTESTVRLKSLIYIIQLDIQGIDSKSHPIIYTKHILTDFPSQPIFSELPSGLFPFSSFQSCSLQK